MIEQYAQSLAQFLQSNPNMGGLIAFFVSFLESLAIIGTIVPGSITMTAVGVLIGRGILPPGLTLLWATVGAFLGDLIGYGLGSYYNERLRNIWPFKGHPQWLEAGEKFIHKHGGKSILIGRFIGPLRSLIPLIAGLLHMPLQKFVIAAIPAALLWAIAYMLPGVLLGALSLQLPPSVATKFILIMLAIIILITIFAWLVKLFYIRCQVWFNRMTRAIWQSLQANPRLNVIPRLLTGPEHPDNYQQLTWLFILILFTIAFGIILFSVLQQTALVSLNRPTFECLRSIRNEATDRFFICITLLGQSNVLGISSILIFLCLLFKQYLREAIHWSVAIAIGVMTPAFFKWIIYIPRPPGLLHQSTTSSFPSGHVFLALLFYGFLATMIATHLTKENRRYVYLTATIIIASVSLSRLYLGAHWLTDALGSITLGYACLAAVTLSYRRHLTTVNIKQLIILCSAILVIVWTSFSILNYHKAVTSYSLLWPSRTIAEETWWGSVNAALPIYRQNRLGKPVEPMNIQYVGDIQQLRSNLISQGWQPNPDLTLLDHTLQKLTHKANNFNGVLPSLYLNHPPILFMTKDNQQGKLLLRLWNSNVYFTQSWESLFVGNIVEYQIDEQNNKVVYSFNVLKKLLSDLNKSHWQVNFILTGKLPKSLVKKNWKGEILQISAPTFY